MDELVEIPASLAESDEWLSLNEDQRLSLLRRLDKVLALGQSLCSGRRFAESTDFADFANELELDGAILQELDSAQRGGLSRWLIHHSWTFETSPSEMRQSLPSVLLGYLDSREPDYDASLDKYRDWFSEMGCRLVCSIEELCKAQTYATVMAIHVLVDILVARILVCCYKLRLNRAVSR